MGDIQFFFVQVTEDTGYFQIQPPDPEKYAADHENEGALDWFKWGPRVN